MTDQRFFKELDEYLSSRPPKKTPPPLELLHIKPIRRKYGYHGMIYGPSSGSAGITSEEGHIRRFLADFNDPETGRRKDFRKKGLFFYENYVLPAAKKLDGSGFRISGQRIIEEQGNGKIDLKNSPFDKYADINSRRISAWKSGAENITRESMLKLVIALKMDLKTAEEFMAAGGCPFDTVNDDQDAIIWFTKKYAVRCGKNWGVKEYRHILKEGHAHAHYRGIYDIPRCKTSDNRAYEPVPDNEAYELTPDYIEELGAETNIFFREGSVKPEVKTLKRSNKEIDQKLLNDYIFPFIDKKYAEGKKIGGKEAYYHGHRNIDLFFRSAGIGQTTKDNILNKENPKKPKKPTMLKLAIAMEMLQDDAQAFLDETGERLKIYDPLDFVIICAMEYEEKNDHSFSPSGFRFSPSGFRIILDRCRKGYEFNYTNPYHDFE